MHARNENILENIKMCKINVDTNNAEIFIQAAKENILGYICKKLFTVI